MNNNSNNKTTTPQIPGPALVRLFVSVELPAPVVEEIKRIQKELKQLDLFEGTYVRPVNLHITLAFFGSVEDAKIPSIHERLSSISLPAYDIKLKALGVNSLSRPHDLWITVEAPLLAILAKQISELFPEYREQRPFNGHITIARMKKVLNKSRLKELLTVFPVHEHAWQAQEFALWQSETLPEGPIYTMMATFPLLPVV